jgi:hypothetical protein
MVRANDFDVEADTTAAIPWLLAGLGHHRVLSLRARLRPQAAAPVRPRRSRRPSAALVARGQAGSPPLHARSCGS